MREREVKYLDHVFHNIENTHVCQKSSLWGSQSFTHLGTRNVLSFSIMSESGMKTRLSPCQQEGSGTNP